MDKRAILIKYFGKAYDEFLEIEKTKKMSAEQFCTIKQNLDLGLKILKNSYFDKK